MHHIELPTTSQALKLSIAFLWLTSSAWPIALISEWVLFFKNLRAPSQISSSVRRLTYSVDKEGKGGRLTTRDFHLTQTPPILPQARWTGALGSSSVGDLTKIIHGSGLNFTNFTLSIFSKPLQVEYYFVSRKLKGLEEMVQADTSVFYFSDLRLLDVGWSLDYWKLYSLQHVARVV